MLKVTRFRREMRCIVTLVLLVRVRMTMCDDSESLPVSGAKNVLKKIQSFDLIGVDSSRRYTVWMMMVMMVESLFRYSEEDHLMQYLN